MKATTTAAFALSSVFALASAPGAVSFHATGPLALGSSSPARCTVQMTAGGSGGAPAPGRRAVLALAAAGALGLRRPAPAAAATEAEDIARLQAEAARIQEIFDVQKELNADMPTLKDGIKKMNAAKAGNEDDKVAKAPAGAEPVDGSNIVKVIDAMMASLKKEGENGMRTVLAYSAPGNPVKNQPYENVLNSMRDSKYGLLFGKFTDYVIRPPSKPVVDPELGATYAAVDVVVQAPYQTMLQNGVQFEELELPQDVELAQQPGSPKLCSVVFRWNMSKMPDGSWVSEGCYTVPLKEL